MNELHALYNELRAYKRSRLLATAVHLGVLDALEPLERDGAEAERPHFPERWLESALNVLCSQGLVVKKGQAFRLTELGRQVRRDEALRAFAGYHYHTYDAWSGLANSMTTGQAGDFHGRRLTDPDFCLSYLESLESIAGSNLKFLMERCSGVLTGRVLDLGAGPSTLCRNLAEANPEMSVKALDVPFMARMARTRFGESPNFQWIEGKFPAWCTETPFDAIYCSHFLEYCPRHDLSAWLGKIDELLVADGCLAIVVFMGNDADILDEALELFHISTGLNSPQLGDIPRCDDFAGVLHEKGFRDIEFHRFPEGPSYAEYLITCKKINPWEAGQ